MVSGFTISVYVNIFLIIPPTFSYKYISSQMTEEKDYSKLAELQVVQEELQSKYDALLEKWLEHTG